MYKGRGEKSCRRAAPTIKSPDIKMPVKNAMEKRRKRQLQHAHEETIVDEVRLTTTRTRKREHERKGREAGGRTFPEQFLGAKRGSPGWTGVD